MFVEGCDGVMASGVTEDSCGVCGGNGWSCVVAGCSWGPGDGVGGTETGIGDSPSAVECSTKVLNEQPTANGATYSNTGGTQCYAEFGMTGANGSTSWQTCLYVPGYCEYVVGDGVGGTETAVGDAATASECVNLVLSAEPTANGATYSTDGTTTACYAEFGMTGVNSSTSWQSCLFPELTICDFVVGDGVGGTETMVGEANGAQECVQLVLDTSADANGATYSTTGGTACYAEFGMVEANSSADWQTCMFTAENGLLPDTGVAGCAWVTGDGVGGTETGVGDADNEAICVSMVRDQQPTANGATYSNTGGTGCYAEFGMTEANSSGSWKTCLFVPGFCDFVPGDGVGVAN